MLRLLIDENFNGRILRGLIHRLPALDLVFVKDIGLKRAKDPVLLDWAARENRVILTHDIRTLVPDAKRMVQLGRNMAGVILVSDRLEIGQAIKELEIVVGVLEDQDLRDRVQHLPF